MSAEPWVADLGSREIQRESDGLVLFVENNAPTEAEGDANLILAAAAPAMLAALEELTEAASALRESALSGHPVVRDNATFITRKIAAARAAIALAKGE